MSRFPATLDETTLQAGTGVPADIALGFVQSIGSPAQGPASVSWDNVFLQFLYTSVDGKDLYWAPADANGEYDVVIAPDLSVVATHSTETLNGTYNSSPGAFNFSGAADSSDLLALNANGVPYTGELSVGFMVQVSFNGPAQQILNGNGTAYTPPTYTFAGPAGAYGVKFTGIPDRCLSWSRDENGNYTAPPYVFVNATGDARSSTPSADGQRQPFIRRSSM